MAWPCKINIHMCAAYFKTISLHAHILKSLVCICCTMIDVTLFDDGTSCCTQPLLEYPFTLLLHLQNICSFYTGNVNKTLGKLDWEN